ncbi:MAG: glycogen synthase GlgA [Methylococcales bacterium]
MAKKNTTAAGPKPTGAANKKIDGKSTDSAKPTAARKTEKSTTPGKTKPHKTTAESTASPTVKKQKKPTSVAVKAKPSNSKSNPASPRNQSQTTKAASQSKVIKKEPLATKTARKSRPVIRSVISESAATDTKTIPQQQSEPIKSEKPPIPESTEINTQPPEQLEITPSVEPPPPEPHHPPAPSLYIVQVTPELAPIAKVGGLADVVTGLTRELEVRGNAVEIILPKYDSMRYDHIQGLCETYHELWVPWYGGAINCTVWFGFVRGHKCFFIEPHSGENFFGRGSIYGFDDDTLRFAFFSRAAIEFLWKSGKHPDIIHCHDWQTALVPVFLYEIYYPMGMTHPRVCYTIHNFKHQGVTGDFLLNATGLNRPDYYFHNDRLLDNNTPHAINLMKGGIVYSNFITTVSPRYSSEVKDGGQGFGLEPTLHTHHAKFGGVVNGVDYDVWNPEIDSHIPVHYGLDNIENKYKNKKALRDRLLITDNEKPVIAFVGRLDPQKGLDLVRHSLFFSLNMGAQFVLLGSSPDSEINAYFWELKHNLNDSPDCHLEVGYDEELAHLIYAGADMMVVPSRFEPCGLTQLISMRYGTIPIVRGVGGLADTVFDKDHSHKALHERNGYVFEDYDNPGLESALSRAIDCFYQYPEHFRELIKNAMNSDYSWNNPGQNYRNIYDHIRNK